MYKYKQVPSTHSMNSNDAAEANQAGRKLILQSPENTVPGGKDSSVIIQELRGHYL